MNYAFITGMGRSGTKFLSNLLALDNQICSYHEYFGNREYWLASWYLGPKYSLPYLKNQKKRIKVDKSLFVDTNSYLNSDIDSLKEIFDNPKLFHLVRNPKKVVPSLMTRRDDKLMHKIPKSNNEIIEWIKMSKLEQVCTNWVETTEILLKHDLKVLKFEELTTNFDYLNTNLLAILNINISKKEYEKFKSRKINKTRGKLYRFIYSKIKGKTYVDKNYTYENFTIKEKNIFDKICGKTMRKLGYK